MRRISSFSEQSPSRFGYTSVISRPTMAVIISFRSVSLTAFVSMTSPSRIMVMESQIAKISSSLWEI